MQTYTIILTRDILPDLCTTQSMANSAPSARVRRTRGVWRYDSAPLEATHSAILDAYGIVLSSICTRV